MSLSLTRTRKVDDDTEETPIVSSQAVSQTYSRFVDYDNEVDDESQVVVQLNKI